jgi:hypothetical protein
VPRILVCVATRAEHAACERGIKTAAHTHELLLTGVGPQRAARSLAERLRHGVQPDLVVSSGFAGAVSPALPLASWITATRVSEWNGAARIPVEDVVLIAGPPHLVRCEVLSSSVLVVGDELESDGSAPIAVDMESAALARVAGQKGIRFAVARMISDTPAHPLPRFLSPFVSALSATTTTERLGALGRGLGRAVADPRGVVRLVKESSSWLRDLEAGWRELALWSGT